MADEEKPNRKEPGFLAHVNREATLRGSIKSTVKNTMRGATAIASASDHVRRGARDVMRPGRVESFEQAMERLRIREADLPLIHNQIALQVWTSLVLATICLACAGNYLLGGMLASGALAAVIGASCLANFAQSSVRALQIRERRLGGQGEWLARPGEWLPNRMEDLVRMQPDDPLRRAELVSALAESGRFYMFIGAVFLGGGIGTKLLDSTVVPVAFTGMCFLVAFLCLVNGGRYSFEVFRRRRGEYCDLLLWVMSPASWIPRVRPAQTTKAKRAGRNGA